MESELVIILSTGNQLEITFSLVSDAHKVMEMEALWKEQLFMIFTRSKGRVHGMIICAVL